MDRILSLKGLRKFAVKPVFHLAVVLGCCLAAAPVLCAQAPAGGEAANSRQNKPAAGAQKSSVAQSQSSANPFPTDLSTVPVLPSKTTPGVLEGGDNGMGNGRFTLPDNDPDPVPSPDDAVPSTANGQGQGFSSSLAGLGPLLPNAEGNLPGSGKQDQNAIAPLPQPTPKQDISVGNFYLSTKDWRGALSRFQSALVLDPDNPDVYWGLAECERHLGDYADARADYLKVMEYDPGSHHAKEARKALEDPEIANAKPAAGRQQPQR